MDKTAAIKNPTSEDVVAAIRASNQKAVRRIVCERTGDVWIWPAEMMSHAEGATFVGATYSQPPGGEILTID